MRLDQDCRTTAEERGLELRISVCDACVRSDPLLLEQILCNLPGNALRYTDKGVVTLGCRTEADRLVLSVSDTGRGIPASRQQDIFEEFVRLDTNGQAVAGGLGLGLAIVKRLASLLGHEVTLKSAPGQGTTFTISVPLGDPQQLLDVAPAHRHGIDDLNGTRVLVIDDESDILDATAALLSNWGCLVTRVTSLEMARRRWQECCRAPRGQRLWPHHCPRGSP